MRNFLILIAVFMSLTQLTAAEEWNQIKPLQTTRAEVLNLLGYPVTPDTHVWGEFYRSGRQNIYISWTHADCYSQDLIYGSPPADLNVLVFKITVKPETRFTFDDIEKWDLSEKNLTPSMFQGPWQTECLGSDKKVCTRKNDEKGFGYTTTTGGKVSELYYYPPDQESMALKDKLPACSAEGK